LHTEWGKNGAFRRGQSSEVKSQYITERKEKKKWGSSTNPNRKGKKVTSSDWWVRMSVENKVTLQWKVTTREKGTQKKTSTIPKESGKKGSQNQPKSDTVSQNRRSQPPQKSEKRDAWQPWDFLVRPEGGKMGLLWDVREKQRTSKKTAGRVRNAKRT